MLEPQRSIPELVPVASAPAETPPPSGFFEPASWQRLAEADQHEVFVAEWLNLQCELIGGVVRAVVVMGAPEEGPFAPIAYWPAGTNGGVALEAVAETVMRERRGVARSSRTTRDVPHTTASDALGFPLLVDDRLYGVIALELERRPASQLQAVMRHLQWGCAWLEVLIRRDAFADSAELLAVVDLVATALEHEKFHASATALVTELATRFGCERVSLGFRRGRHARVRALSHSADFSNKTNLIRALGAAMDEAGDQQTTLVYPPSLEASSNVVRAHAELCNKHGAGSICTLPLSDNGRLVGAITLERASDKPFTEDEVSLCEHLAALAGPILDAKRKEDRWLVQKTWDSGRGLLWKLLGPRHVGFKLLSLVLIGVTVFLFFAVGIYRVTTDASLEGTIQRVITAPQDGYISETHARAGDIVRKGELLAALEDKDLQLERMQQESQKEQRLREYSKALAAQDRAQVRILGAQIEQAEAQLRLLDEQLERTQIIAPFDGVLVTGDLNQSLGAPVERGQILFEVAPLDHYRVVLAVDEREISQIKVGQSGQLVLAGLPGEHFPLEVQKITPVSSAEEGRNFFRVEATLGGSTEALRPGMEGVAKIDIDTRKLAWIYTHKLGHWLRLWFWAWWH